MNKEVNVMNKVMIRMAGTVLGCLLLQSVAWAQLSGFEQVQWQTEEVVKGVVWKHAHTPALLNVSQNINILEVDTRKRDITLVYDKDKNRHTSEMSREANALASVNGGFFDMEKAGSESYIKVDGAVPDKDTLKWRAFPRYTGTFIITTKGRIIIEKKGDHRKYTANKKYDDVLIAGYLLIDDGMKVNLPDDKFVTKRHPRTCLGITSKNKVILVTVDGRADQADGMSLNELTDLMVSLECTDAINLDGGGSTTMWLAKYGVVNMPSDNKKFDHEGERPVSNIIKIY